MGLGGLSLPAIIAVVAAAAAAAATQGYAAAAATTSPSVVATTPSTRLLSPLKRLHLHFICGVATDSKIPRIWLEVGQATTKAAALAVLSQYLWEGRELLHRDFFGSADMMHGDGYLFVFVHMDRFVNPWNNPAFPSGDCSAGQPVRVAETWR